MAGNALLDLFQAGMRVIFQELGNSQDDTRGTVSALEGVVVENYILKMADKEHFPDTKVGAWVQVLKC